VQIQELTSIPVIDAHTHMFPPKLFQAVKSWFKAHGWDFITEGTAEDFLQAGFDMGFAGFVTMAYAHKPGIARGLNEFMGDLVKRFPNTVGLAAIHPHDENPKDILRHAYEECGLSGVKIHCHVKRIAPDDPSMFPIYEAVLERDGIINMHAGKEPAIEAYGMDVRTITGADRVENVLRRYPDLKLVIPHLGIDEADRFFDLVEEFPNLYLDTAMVITDVFPVEFDVRRMINLADRILYGSDYPHIPHPLETEVAGMLEMGIGESVLRKIFHENARKLFPF
jgi:hypothetical protein